MKIGIITLHRVRNYGSVFQAYALCEVLKDRGHEPIVIDYIPERFRLRSDLFFVRPDRYMKGENKNYAKKFLFMCASIAPRFYYYTRFSNFVKKYIPISTKKYFNIDELKKENFDFDLLMNGSDQVWNMSWESSVDRVFFLDFVPEGIKKGAYAASFGKKTLLNNEKVIMAPLLKKYDFITVREKSGLDILKDMGISTAKFVLDPTLLFDRKRWSFLVAKKIIKFPYLLVYQLNYKTSALEYAQIIAQKLSLKVVDLSRKFKATADVDINKPFVKPITFLNAFYYADYVVTDSFHGTAFSVNFNKPFISIKNDYPERVGSLLELLGLGERFVDSGNSTEIISCISKEIDYTKVNAILDRERKTANLLLDGLGGK